MKTEFETWVILAKNSAPLEKFSTEGTPQRALYEATQKMKSMGAQVAEARNLSSFKGKPSLLVYSPSFPLIVIILGAQLTDSKGDPLVGRNSETGLSPLVPPLNE